MKEYFIFKVIIINKILCFSSDISGGHSWVSVRFIKLQIINMIKYSFELKYLFAQTYTHTPICV